MQPRRRFSESFVPFDFATVFHVTKSGVAVGLSSLRAREKRLLRLLLLLVAELASLAPLGVEMVLCTLDELVVAGEGARSRETAAGRYGDPSGAVGAVSASTSSASSAPGALGSEAEGSALYFFHSSSTCCRFRASRFSRSAESASKQ